MTRNDAFTAFRLPSEMTLAIAEAASRAGKSRSAWLRSILAVILAALSKDARNA